MMEAKELIEVDSEEELMLTTIDNPFNPKKDYEKWKQFDMENGYYTEDYIARIANIPVDVDLNNEPIINDLTNKAIHEILENDVLEIYKLI